MNDLKNINECQIYKAGVCAFHEINIERRKNLEKEIDEMKPIKSAVWGLLGTSGLFLIIVIASFKFSNDSRIESIQRDFIQDSKFEILTKMLIGW